MEYTKRLTNQQFKLLSRNSDGDIIELEDVFIFLKPTQVELLTGDDYSRYDNLQEEMRCLMADAMAEFA